MLAGNTISKRPLAKTTTWNNGFCVILSEIVPKTTFWAQNKNQHPILSPCTKFEFNWLRNKKVTKKPYFRWNDWEIREPKLEMTSYSDNAYDVTNFLLFWKVLGLYCIPTKFHCCQTPNGRVNLGGAFCPLSNIGVARTPSKIGLKQPPSLWKVSFEIGHAIVFSLAKMAFHKK